MSRDGLPRQFEFFSTCPPSGDTDPVSYVQQVTDVARWSDAAGCTGILVYTDNGLVDPWLVADAIIRVTERLSPLVAVQPVYMHPYTVAKLVTTLGFLHGRRLFLNMVAGGFRNDLDALGDSTEHDRRYDRVVEYTTIIQGLLRGGEPVTLEGDFYQVKNLRLVPPLRRELFPGITMSGSSPAALAAAKHLGAVAVQYPKPSGENGTKGNPDVHTGIRIGIIARSRSEEAWELAHARFPPDRKGQLTHQLAMKVSDSSWHHQLSALAKESAERGNPYWLVPFENYKTFCPYLVGSYEQVARELTGYLKMGHETFILDVPRSEEDFAHVGEAFRVALR